MAVSSPALDGAGTSSARRKLFPSTICLPGRRRIAFRSLPGIEGAAMDLFTKLFGDLLVFVYHCFDRIVIRGDPDGAVAARAGRPLLPARSKGGGGQQGGAEPADGRLPELGGSLRAQSRDPDRMGREGGTQGGPRAAMAAPHGEANVYGVYFIFKSMEQGPTFRISLPKYPAKDPHYRIVAHQRSRFTHYYFYVRDAALGPMVVRVASFFPFQTAYYLNGHSFIEQELKRAGIGFRKHDNAFLAVDDVAALQAAADRRAQRSSPAPRLLDPDPRTEVLKKERAKLNLSRFYAVSQIEYCRNFIFRRHFPIHKLFERSCELGLWRLSADKIATIFGKRVSRRMHGKLATVIDQIEHGHHVFRAYFKSGFLKQYEKFLTFLRNELVSNDLTDFGLRRGSIISMPCGPPSS